MAARQLGEAEVDEVRNVLSKRHTHQYEQVISIFLLIFIKEVMMTSRNLHHFSTSLFFQYHYVINITYVATVVGVVYKKHCYNPAVSK